MTKTIVNFNAGPSGLPREALEKAQRELLDFNGTGMSVMEHSHRGKAYDAVHQETLTLIRTLSGVPDSHDILFLQGGASGIFATLPMNFLGEGQTADYVLTGAWSKKAYQEAQNIGTARIAGTGEVDGKFIRIPSQGELDLSPSPAYVHITSNNTIAGTQFSRFYSGLPGPLAVDMSSDIFSRPIDVASFGMIYAGAQKNLGPAGVTLAIIEKSWIEKGSTKIPKIFRYKTHADAGSLYNTPPTFGIYLMRNVLQWIQENGGLAGMEKRNSEKAAALYQVIDESGGYYHSPVEKACRSKMNVVWRLPSEDLEKKFLEASIEAGLIGLKGHRSVGGLRASIYNAVSQEGVARLTRFMGEFRAKHG